MKLLITAVYEGNPEDKYSYTPGGIEIDKNEGKKLKKMYFYSIYYRL